VDESIAVERAGGIAQRVLEGGVVLAVKESWQGERRKDRRHTGIKSVSML
jgi:hypothetical protein